MDKAYYKSYFYYERHHWWFKARSAIIGDYIAKHATRTGNLKILNVGVATGASTTLLQQFGKVTSLEYEQDCIDFVKDKVNFEIIQGSILELPFEDNSFDLVCAFDVIEHVEDDRKAVKELARVCRPKGNVIVTVPAFMSLWSEHDEINHHFRRYTKRSLSDTFTALDYGRIFYCSFFNSLLFPFILTVRKLFKSKSSDRESLQSDFERFNPGFFNSVLFHLMRSEKFIISSGAKFPFGVSLLLHWIKD